MVVWLVIESVSEDGMLWEDPTTGMLKNESPINPLALFSNILVKQRLILYNKGG